MHALMLQRLSWPFMFLTSDSVDNENINLVKVQSWFLVKLKIIGRSLSNYIEKQTSIYRPQTLYNWESVYSAHDRQVTESFRNV